MQRYQRNCLNTAIKLIPDKGFHMKNLKVLLVIPAGRVPTSETVTVACQHVHGKFLILSLESKRWKI